MGGVQKLMSSEHFFGVEGLGGKMILFEKSRGHDLRFKFGLSDFFYNE